jgi:hypothetical protein
LINAICVTDDHWQADVDGVPKEDTGKGWGQDSRKSPQLDDQCGLFSGGAQPKVSTSHDEITWLHFPGELWGGILENMPCQLRKVGT